MSSLSADQKAAILEAQASGQSDPAIIAILTGCETSAVQEFLSKRSQRTPQEELQGEIDRTTDLIQVAEMEYRSNPSNQNAQAIRTLQATRRDLIKDLSTYADPDRDVRILDSAILAPFIEEVLLHAATFVRSTRTENVALSPDDKADAVKAAFDNNFVLFTQRVETSYRTVFGRLSEHFDVNVDVDELDSSNNLLDSSSLDEAEGPVRPARKKGAK